MFCNLTMALNRNLPAAVVPQPTSAAVQGDQLAKYLKQEAKGKMMAIYNKLKKNCGNASDIQEKGLLWSFSVSMIQLTMIIAKLLLILRQLRRSPSSRASQGDVLTTARFEHSTRWIPRCCLTRSGTP